MKPALTSLCNLHDWLTRVSAGLAGIGLSLIVVFYVYEVITRYLFNSPTAWVSDFVSYVLAASVFLALPRVTQAKAHIAVTILVDALPLKLAGLIHSFIYLLGFLSLAFAAWVSFGENLRQFSKNIETLAIIPIPQWWVSGFITFGLALSSLHMLRQMPPSNQRADNAFVERTD